MNTLIKLSISALFLLTALPTISQAEEESYWSWLFTFESRKGVAPVSNETYLEECGACHFAYQPGLMPEASWKKLLTRDALTNHFKENAELEETVRLKVLGLLKANSADKSRYKRSKKIMVSLPEGSTPTRITEIPYIKQKHHDVVKNIVEKSDKVKSLSYCDDCHQKTGDGIFDDDTVFIPGIGYYDE